MADTVEMREDQVVVEEEAKATVEVAMVVVETVKAEPGLVAEARVAVL